MQRFSLIVLALFAATLLTSCASDTTTIKTGGYSRVEVGR